MLTLEGMMNELGVGEMLAEIRKSRKISQAKFAPRRRRRYDLELRARTQRADITRLYDAKRGRQPRVEYICRRVTAQTSLSVTASVPMRRQARRSSQRNGTSVVTEMKSRQASGKTCHAQVRRDCQRSACDRACDLGFCSTCSGSRPPLGDYRRGSHDNDECQLGRW